MKGVFNHEIDIAVAPHQSRPQTASSAIKNKSNTITYDFMHPSNKDSSQVNQMNHMHQLLGNYAEWRPNYYINNNKKMLREIQKDVEMVKGQAELERKLRQQQQSWKMKRFSGVAPRVNIAKPHNEDTMNLTQTSKMLIDSKHYIKQNVRQVLQIET